MINGRQLVRSNILNNYTLSPVLRVDGSPVAWSELRVSWNFRQDIIRSGPAENLFRRMEKFNDTGSYNVTVTVTDGLSEIYGWIQVDTICDVFEYSVNAVTYPYNGDPLPQPGLLALAHNRTTVLLHHPFHLFLTTHYHMTTGKCALSWAQHRQKEYSLHTTPLTHAAAANVCISHQATIAAPPSGDDETRHFLAFLLRQSNVASAWLGLDGDDGGAWELASNPAVTLPDCLPNSTVWASPCPGPTLTRAFIQANDALYYGSLPTHTRPFFCQRSSLSARMFTVHADDAAQTNVTQSSPVQLNISQLGSFNLSIFAPDMAALGSSSTVSQTIHTRYKLPPNGLLPFSHRPELLAGHMFNISINTDHSKCRRVILILFSSPNEFKSCRYGDSLRVPVREWKSD